MESNVKDIRVQPIDGKSAAAFVRRHHYSGKVAGNSQLHFGAFYAGKLHGVLSFGPPMDKRKVLGLVAGTGWNAMCELNRMAFDDFLPRNAESRVIGVCLRLLKKHCPHIKWVLSFADATQCGDGTIYRATGGLLTGIRTNTSLYEFPTGHRIAAMTFEATFNATEIVAVCRALGVEQKYRTRKQWEALGAKPIPGYQLRYVFLLDKSARLTVPVLPYSAIDELGAGMYKGQNKPVSERKPHTPAPEAQTEERPDSIGEAGGSIPTPALQLSQP
jgi:hypothetical protein